MGKSPSDFASLVTSPLREEAFSRAKPAQKGSSLRGELAELARPEGLSHLAASVRPHKNCPRQNTAGMKNRMLNFIRSLRRKFP